MLQKMERIETAKSAATASSRVRRWRVGVASALTCIRRIVVSAGGLGYPPLDGDGEFSRARINCYSIPTTAIPHQLILFRTNFYSIRRACTGLVLAARRAGRMAATHPATTNVII